MMFLRAGSVVAMLAVVAAGCRPSARPSVKVDGSSTVYPVSEAVAEEFRHEQPEVRITVGRSGTGGGFKKFAAGDIDLCDASRPIKESERAECAAHGVEFIELEVAFDGLAVIANPENDWCDCLTVEQLKAIWQPESAVDRWSDVDPDWPDEPLQLYGPGTDSGTFDYFTEVIVGDEDASRADYTASEDDNVLVTGVEGGPYALGYFGYAYYNENRGRLKLLGVDPGDGQCVEPSEETVRNNTYRPLSRPLYLYVRTSSLERPEVKAFVEFYLDHIESLVPQVGYVAVPDEVRRRNRQRYEQAIGPSGAPEPADQPAETEARAAEPGALPTESPTNEPTASTVLEPPAWSTVSGWCPERWPPSTETDPAA